MLTYVDWKAKLIKYLTGKMVRLEIDNIINIINNLDKLQLEITPEINQLFADIGFDFNSKSIIKNTECTATTHGSITNALTILIGVTVPKWYATSGITYEQEMKWSLNLITDLEFREVVSKAVILYLETFNMSKSIIFDSLTTNISKAVNMDLTTLDLSEIITDNITSVVSTNKVTGIPNATLNIYLTAWKALVTEDISHEVGLNYLCDLLKDNMFKLVVSNVITTQLDNFDTSTVIDYIVNATIDKACILLNYDTRLMQIDTTVTPQILIIRMLNSLVKETIDDFLQISSEEFEYEIKK